MTTVDNVNVHSLLLIGVNLKCIFTFASEYRTHLDELILFVGKDTNKYEECKTNHNFFHF